ncbi:MAG: FliM/FliN family flagellar motor switch protein [Phycisphaerae bacterium]
MTARRENSHLVVEQLRQAAGSGKEPIYSDIEAADYDWLRPHAFTSREMVRLGELMHRAARNVSRRLSEQLQCETEVAVGEVEQLYRHTFRNQRPEGAEYVYPFSRAGAGPCGLLLVTRPDAVALVTKMLGSSSEQSATERELSSLETDLLGYLLGGVMDSVSDALREWGGATLEAEGKVLEDERPVPESITELCRVDLQAQDDGHFGITLLLDTTVVGQVVSPQTFDQTPAEQVAADLREHVGRAPVRLTVRLGTVQVPMRMVAELSEGDVMVLPTRIDTPLTVRAEGKPVLQGHPVASHGHCGLKINARLAET